MSTHSARHSTKLERVRIATPCPISWDEMTGDSRVRCCGHCQLNVYDISELSRIEAERLIASTEGRLCVRLFRRADGTILTKDCPVGLRALRRRVAKRTAVVFAAIVSLSAAAFGRQSSGKVGKASRTTQTRITRTDAASHDAQTILSGTVLDPAGAVIRGTRVTLTNADTKEIKTTLTNDAGRFEFAALVPGYYSITIEATAFKTLLVTNVILNKGEMVDLDTTLEITSDELIGVVASDELVDTFPDTTIIKVDVIRKLPIP